MEEPLEEPIFKYLQRCDEIWLDWMPELAHLPVPVAKTDVSTNTEEVVQNAKAVLLALENTAPQASSVPHAAPQYYEYAADRLQYILNVTAFPQDWILTKEQLLNCSFAMRPLERHYKARLRNRFELGNHEDVAFVMVPTNRSSVLQSVDDIRFKRNKFVCLNDNINHTDPRAGEVIRVLQDFYKAILPLPSPFELPHGQTNKYLHVDELLVVRSAIQHKKTQIYALVAFIVFLLLIALKMFTKRSRTANAATINAQRFRNNNSPLRHPDPIIMPSYDV